MLTNTTAMAPTDIWKLSDAHIKPQSGDQLSEFIECSPTATEVVSETRGRVLCVARLGWRMDAKQAFVARLQRLLSSAPSIGAYIRNGGAKRSII